MRLKVCVSGGCGYVGSVLVPKLLQAGHEIWVIDLQWFDNHLKAHPHLAITKADFREPFSFDDVDAIIHLAAVANDPTGDLNPKLTWEINALGTMQLSDSAARQGVKQFIYASSGSVYGVNDALQITEDTPLVPLSEYNKTKAVAERVLLSYADRMRVQILRPATVCGFSPRMRLDTVVNAITMQALTEGAITINGGGQYRPNIHIDDMADVYLWMLERPHLTGIYNAGFENMTVADIAGMVSRRLGCAVAALPSNDPRSYRINADKLLATGFRPRKTVADAIEDIIVEHGVGALKDEPRWHNLFSMPKAT